MPNTQLAPEKIKSPIQLMAAWFTMLVLLVSVLLTAAANISKPDWAAGYLIIFASIIIIMVICCVLLMLTKFRPNLQEGKDYAQWLKDQNAYSSGYVLKTTAIESSTVQMTPSSKSLKAINKSTSSFLISVANAVGAIDLVETLKNASFNAEVYEQPLSRSEQEKTLTNLEDNACIWVGSRIAPGPAIKAIKLALSIWPHLKYLHLSGDREDSPNEPPDYVHEQLFFGGATSVSKRYGLCAWSSEDLLQLNDNISLSEFHAAIRQRYS